MRHVKIVATIGPSSQNEKTLEKMINAGMNVARLNFSHGSHPEHEKVFEIIRSIDETIGIAIDITGPKIRIGELDQPYNLQIGEKVTLTTRDIIGNKETMPINYPQLTSEIGAHEPIFVNDGLVKLQTIEVTEEELLCEVLDGGIISSRKGVNVPTANISLHVPTDKDKNDLEKACELEADFIFVSFVRKVNDLEKIQEIIHSCTDSRIPLISKIEHRDAVSNVREILSHCDGLMVARGDLGIEIGPARVPVLQKQLIDLGRKKGKPVIVATQMLESMVEEPIPTRAEASDVAHAVFDCADALMLSAETATGIHPAYVIKVMDDIIREAETSKHVQFEQQLGTDDLIGEVIGQAAVRIGKQIKTKAIVALTQTGYSARMVSKNRISLPIIAVTPDEQTLRRLQLHWGIKPVLHSYYTEYDQLVYGAIETLHKKKFVNQSDNIVLVAGSMLGIPGKTNTIQILNIGETIAGRH